MREFKRLTFDLIIIPAFVIDGLKIPLNEHTLDWLLGLLSRC
jgi:hypothetical protein